MLKKTEQLINDEMKGSFHKFNDFISQPSPRKIPSNFLLYISNSRAKFLFTFSIILFIGLIVIILTEYHFFDSDYKQKQLIRKLAKLPAEKTDFIEVCKKYQKITFTFLLFVVFSIIELYTKMKKVQLFKEGTLKTAKLIYAKRYKTRHSCFYEIKIAIDSQNFNKYKANVSPEIIDKLRENEFEVLYNKSKKVIVPLDIIYKDTYKN
ncbi:hypothetical protein AAEX28_13730 [Lentisphaerota bacterium WC36G]|nr:hypothetical protein LJT99_00485 [Lentisphaerae bacterium WC36]